MAAKNQAFVSFEEDDYSISQEFWKTLKDKMTQGKEIPHYSFTGEDGITFDYYYDKDEDKGITPLMKSVQLNYIKKTLNILLFDANPNMQHKDNGDTALHLAVDSGNISLVKLLLSFNADPNVRNSKYQTPVDVAEYMLKRKASEEKWYKLFSFGKSSSPSPTAFDEREIKDKALDGNIEGILKAMKESINLHHKTQQYFNDHPTIPLPSKERNSGIYLLSLDGGGVRIYNALQAMINIEKRMEELTSKKHQMWSYFDYVCGTSAGGLAGCAMVYAETDAFICRALLFERMFDVFNTSVNKRGDKMDIKLQEVFTEDRTLSDLNPSHPRVIITASLADYTPYELHLMTSYGEPRDGQAGPRERKIWEACRITSCSPKHFSLFNDLHLLDGGLVCNNPTLDCMAEIIDQGEREGTTIKFNCVVSFGTGVAPKHASEEIEFLAPSLLSFVSLKNIQALQNLFHHFMDQATLSDGREIAKAQSFCKVLGCQYYRLSPLLKKEISLDTTDETKLIDMMYNTQMYYLDNPELIDNVAKCLLSK